MVKTKLLRFSLDESDAILENCGENFLQDIVDKMSRAMSESQNRIFMREFKKFFLELLYFYWSLSNDNPIIEKLEKSFKMTIPQYSSYIAKTPMSLAIMQQIVDILRHDLGIVVKSNVVLKSSGEFLVEFDLYLIGEGK